MLCENIFALFEQQKKVEVAKQRTTKAVSEAENEKVQSGNWSSFYVVYNIWEKKFFVLPQKA